MTTIHQRSMIREGESATFRVKITVDDRKYSFDVNDGSTRMATLENLKASLIKVVKIHLLEYELTYIDEDKDIIHITEEDSLAVAINSMRTQGKNILVLEAKKVTPKPIDIWSPDVFLAHQHSLGSIPEGGSLYQHSFGNVVQPPLRLDCPAIASQRSLSRPDQQSATSTRSSTPSDYQYSLEAVTTQSSSPSDCQYSSTQSSPRFHHQYVTIHDLPRLHQYSASGPTQSSSESSERQKSDCQYSTTQSSSGLSERSEVKEGQLPKSFYAAVVEGRPAESSETKHKSTTQSVASSQIRSLDDYYAAIRYKTKQCRQDPNCRYPTCTFYHLARKDRRSLKKWCKYEYLYGKGGCKYQAECLYEHGFNPDVR